MTRYGNAEVLALTRRYGLQLRQLYETADVPAEVVPPEEKAKEEARRAELKKKHGQ